MDEIYLARSDDHELRKQLWFENGQLQEKIDPGKLFHYEAHECRRLVDVFDLLTELSDDPSRSIVAGRPLVAHGEKSADRFDDPETPWWMIDLDGLKRRASVEATIEHYLPCLSGASYVYAFSQKADVLGDDLRVRVVVKLRRPMKRSHLRAYAEHYNQQIVAFEGLSKKSSPVDPRIYTPNQFIFTSRPKLIGIEDPHPVRVFMVEGWRGVTLPELPKMVEVTFETGPSGVSSLPYINRETGLPQLLNFGHHASEGHLRGDDANKALGRLKHLMGADAFSAGGRHNEKRHALWLKILQDSGATPTEMRKYGDFDMRRWRYAQERSDHNVLTVMAEECPDATMELAKAERTVKAAISRGMSRTEVTAVSATPGVGKTHVMLAQIKERIEAADGSFNVDIYVPTIDLAREMWRKCRSMGISAFVEYGRSSRVDEEDPIQGGEMACIKPDLNDKIGSVVENVSQSLCDDGEMQCPMIESCRHMWQRRMTQDIPVRIRAHAFLSRQMPSESNPDYRPVHLAVIDEASFVNALIHTPPAIEIKDLIAPRLEGDDYAWVLRFAQVVNVNRRAKVTPNRRAILTPFCEARARGCPSVPEP